jgi:ubiquinone/menaquinone biosynthesis C-methylase UbiE
MADRFKNIYQNHADQYEALIAREDYQHRLLPALEAIRPLAGLEVVETGAGTGRLTRLVAPHVKQIKAFDAAAPMLEMARLKLTELGLHNWELQVAEHKSLPVADQSVDLTLSGWTYGHIQAWYPDDWQAEINRVLAELRRVIRPGGTIIIIETLGTGFETPRPPSPGLAAYYNFLAQEHNFSHTAIRTDFRFASLDEAERLIRFFFGDALGEQVRANNWVILPECTGLWWQHL